MVESESKQSVNKTGFRCWNKLDREIQRLRQLYDFTLHLYLEENERLRQRLAKSRGQGQQAVHTRVGTTTRGIQTLIGHTQTVYPRRLRQLVLISLVMHLESFLTDLVVEISERDLRPFQVESRIEFPRGQLLSFKSLDAIRDHLVACEVRRLTSGGLEETRKFFKSRFDIDFLQLKADYKAVCETHERRHLHVHRNGVCDAQYARKFPVLGYSPGDSIPIAHDYLIKAFDVIYGFASEVQAEALKRYPVSIRKKKVARGALPPPSFDHLVLLIRLEVLDPQYDPLEAIPQIILPAKDGGQRDVNDFLYQVIVEEAISTLVVGGSQEEIKRLMTALKGVKEIQVRSVSQLFS